jgi:hypothetical protein
MVVLARRLPPRRSTGVWFSSHGRCVMNKAGLWRFRLPNTLALYYVSPNPDVGKQRGKASWPEARADKPWHVRRSHVSNPWSGRSQP